MKCPFCKGEEFMKTNTVQLFDGENFVINGKNCFVCKTCGYTFIFDDRVPNVHKCYWPEVNDEDEC